MADTPKCKAYAITQIQVAQQKIAFIYQLMLYGLCRKDDKRSGEKTYRCVRATAWGVELWADGWGDGLPFQLDVSLLVSAIMWHKLGINEALFHRLCIFIVMHTLISNTDLYSTASYIFFGWWSGVYSTFYPVCLLWTASISGKAAKVFVFERSVTTVLWLLAYYLHFKMLFI